jgi:hypothetical protein
VRVDPGIEMRVSDLRGRLDAAGLTIESVRPIAASLEDVFIARLST